MNKRILVLLFVALLTAGCNDQFYLTESETASLRFLFSTDQQANLLCDNLQTQQLNIQFDSNSPPHITSSNLATILNSTELGSVGVGSNVSSTRISSELEKQIEYWVTNRLELYAGATSASGVKLQSLDAVRMTFANNPTFSYDAKRQSIAFNLNVSLSIDGTLDVDVLDDFTNFFFGVNGTYPLTISVNPLVMNGEISLLTGNNSGRFRFRLVPQPGVVSVLDRGSSSAPGSIKDGLRQLMTNRMSSTIDEIFDQKYSNFILTSLRLVDSSPVKLEVDYRQIPRLSDPLLHTVSRGSDGKLYHARKSTGAWGPFTQISAPFLNSVRIDYDPTIVANGADQLELAAVNASGQLAYAHWRLDSWVNDTVRAPTQSTYRGRPAVVASAPGQVEIVVERSDGGLWHMRRLNGAWSNATQLPLTGFPSIIGPFRNPAAVQAGNKMVVVFTDSQNKLRAIAYQFETNTWCQPTTINTAELLQFAPAAVASADGRVDVVYAAQSGIPYHIGLDIQATSTTGTGISYGPETNIGGSLNSSPELASSGYRILEMVGRGTDNKLYHNRYVPSEMAVGTFDGRTVSTGWQGSTSLNGNFYGSTTISGERMEEFAAMSTRAGQLEVVSRVRPTPFLDDSLQQYIFHNQYDSSRFGRYLWKTVNWRGYERLSTQRFLGRPALALVERAAEAAYVASDFKLRYSRFGDANEPNFAGFPEISTVLGGESPSDPTIVSSGPGLIDLLWIAMDGRPRHLRFRNQRYSLERTLAVPAGVSFRSRPAVVAYGNGQLDMVAVSSTNALYHWRFRNGSWSASPTLLSGSSTSTPVLTYTGSGQLELLTVAADDKLSRLRFINGAWIARQQIPASFSINASHFTTMSASSWGDGTVDVLVVSRGTGALYHRRIGRTDESSTITIPGQPPPRVFSLIGGVVVDTPALAAFGPADFHVLAIGTDNCVYSSLSRIDPSWSAGYTPAGSDPTILWTGFYYLGGNSLLMGNVANGGPRNLTTLGIDRNGLLFVNRFNGMTWSDFQPMVGPTAETGFAPPAFRPAITASQ